MSDGKSRVTCGNCGTVLAFRPEQAGGRFRCPKCKEPVDLVADGQEGPGAVTKPAAVKAPARPGAAPPARGPARPAPEQEEPARPAARSGLAGRGRGAAAATPARAAAPAPAATTGNPKKKTMLIAAGGGGALLVAALVIGIFAMKGPSRPENAGKVSEGKEVWKALSADFKSAENKDDAESSRAAFERLVAAANAQRATHDYGWPDYFAGRALRRMGKDAEALAAFDAAIGKLEKSAQGYARVERGLIGARAAQEKLLTTRRFRAGGVSIAPDEATTEAAKAALADLNVYKEIKETEFFPAGMMALAEAESLLLEGRGQAAQNKLEVAIGSRIEAGYAGSLSAGIYFEYDKWDLGLKAAEAALAAESGSAFARLTRCWGLRRRALADPGNEEAGAWLDQATELATKARDAGHPAGAVALGALALDRAIIAMDKGQDAKALLDDADARITEALTKSADDPAVKEIQAVIRVKRGELDERAGRDPRPALDTGIAGLDAIASDGKDIPALLNRARALLKRARAEASRGGDARSLYDRAAADFTAVRGRDGAGGASIEPILGAATANVEKAIEDSKRGQDASAVFERVINEMSSVLGSRNDPGALEARGLARWALGEALARQGKDGGEQIDKALDDLTEVFNLRPSIRIGLLMADAWMSRGEAALKANMDPKPGFDGAARALDGILTRLAPGNPDLLMRKGRACSRAGEFERKADGDARARCKQAVDAFTEVLKGDPNNVEALAERGHALLNMGWSEVRKNTGDPRVTLNLAIGDLDKALAADPKHFQAALEKGDAVMLVGQIDFNRNNDAQETFARAVSCFEVATRLDEKHGEAWNLLGSAWLLSGQSQRKTGKNASASWEAAEAALRKAISLEYWKAHINLGMVLAYQKQWEAAEAEWKKADEKCPDAKEQDRLRERREWVKELKKRMAEE